MTTSIRDRATFDALRRHGRRVASGPLWIRHLPAADGGPPRVAFAIGRRVGGAVTRNRVRRRLRVVLRELDQAGQIPPGAYLVGVAPGGGDADLHTLRHHTERLLQRLEARG